MAVSGKGRLQSRARLRFGFFADPDCAGRADGKSRGRVPDPIAYRRRAQRQRFRALTRGQARVWQAYKSGPIGPPHDREFAGEFTIHLRVGVTVQKRGRAGG